jgi:hypothetical protein
MINAVLVCVTAAIALGGTWQGGDEQRLAKPLFLQLVDGELSSIESMSYDYEISVEWDKQLSSNAKARAMDGPVSTYYGHVAWVNSGSFHLKSSKSDNLSGVESLAETWLTEGKRTSYERNMNVAYGFAEISDAGLINYDWEYTAFDFYPLFMLRAHLQREESDLIDEGGDKGGDASLRILRLILAKNLPAGTGPTIRLWISLNGGLRVRKTEARQGENLICATEYTQFQEFALADKSVWIPAWAKKKTFVGYDRTAGKVFYLERPNATQEYNLIRDKVVVKDGRVAKEIAVHIPKGTRVDDRVKKRSYEEGQDLRRSPRTNKEYDERLQEYLKLASTSGTDIRARSLARDGTPWSYWISGVAAGAFMLGLFKLLYDKLRQYRLRQW